MNDKLFNQTPPGFKAGFVTIAGAPNVGKSTLLNRLLGEKLSIVSDKPQTTRNKILGILHSPKSQLVFFDTPGVHKPEGKLNIKIVEAAINAISEADVVIAMIDAIDAQNQNAASNQYTIKSLEKKKGTAVLAINKIDAINKDDILQIIEKWSKLFKFEEIVPISAKNGTQVDKLIEAVEKLIPYGPPFFPEDMITNMPERFFAAEMIRENIFKFTGHEVPYSTAVTVDSFKRKKNHLIKIDACIYVEKESQKPIIIGKNGSMLKKIGQTARAAIEKMTGERVFLNIFVKVGKNWSKDQKMLSLFGY